MTRHRPVSVGIGMPAALRLDVFAQQVFDAFGDLPYLVGSTALSKTWRDVDVRLMLPDEEFAAMIPGYRRLDQHDPKWALVCDSLSELAHQQKGLPVDFQIQAMTDANTRYPEGPRVPLGMRVTRPGSTAAALTPADLPRTRGTISMLSHEELAKAAYDAYGEETGHKNHRGEPMPAWEDPGDTIQGAWIRAAIRVAELVTTTATAIPPEGRPPRRRTGRSRAVRRPDVLGTAPAAVLGRRE